MAAFPLLPWPLRTLLGMRSATLDVIGAEVAAAHGALHRPYARVLGPEQFSADGYHPSPAGHQAVADGIAELAERALSERPEWTFSRPAAIPVLGRCLDVPGVLNRNTRRSRTGGNEP